MIDKDKILDKDLFDLIDDIDKDTEDEKIINDIIEEIK